MPEARRILLAGGLGYIGAHTAVELIEAGYDVVIADNLSNSCIEVLGAITRITGVRPIFEQVELCDRTAVRGVLRRHCIAGCIHLAAHKAAGESMREPLMYHENNNGALIAVLSEYVHAGLDNFVFSSSSAVYGDAHPSPVAEGQVVWPAESVYGTTKAIGEQILRDAAAAYQLNTIALRCFNPIGAHPSAEIGELPLGGPQNIVTLIARTAVERTTAPLRVFGGDYPTCDGTCVRDYVHVMDVARAHVMALDRLIARTNVGPAEVFNVGTGRGLSVLELIDLFERGVGRQVPWTMAPRREGDTVAVFADPGKAHRMLHWQARRGVEDGLVDVWRWQNRLLRGAARRPHVVVGAPRLGRSVGWRTRPDRGAPRTCEPISP